MKKWLCCLLIFLSCIGIFCAVEASAGSINSARIVYIKPDASTWEIKILNNSSEPLNGVFVQAFQSIYRPEEGASFENDLSPASGFKIDLPAKGAEVRKTTWNRRNEAKTLKLNISWQGSTRTVYVNLTRQNSCASADTRNQNVPVYIESMKIADATFPGYTNKVVIVFNNPTSNLIITRITPWQRGPNGDKLAVMNWQKNMYPGRTTEVDYHFNEIEGTEQFGVIYGLVYGFQEDVSEKVICKGSGPRPMQQQLKLKTKTRMFERQ